MKRLLISLAALLPATASAYDVVVIGAGGGGLSAAATLAQSGLEVLVVEQHSKVGGYMTSFERDDYRFEVSLHAMDGLDKRMGITRPVFEILDIEDRVTPVRIEKPYRLEYPQANLSLDISSDPKEYKSALMAEFPDERGSIRSFFSTMSRMKGALLAFKNLEAGAGLKALMTLITRPNALTPRQRYDETTLSQLLDDHFDDEQLRSVLSWMCAYSGTAPEVMPAQLYLGMWSSYHYGGFYYFEGGSQAISDALADVIVEYGGEIMLSTRASQIVVEDGKAVGVRTESGLEIPCKYVVSNANAPATLFHLVGKEYLPQEYSDSVEAMEPSVSIFQTYLGVDRDFSEAFGGNHTISIFENLELFSEGSNEAESTAMFIVNYSLVDPEAAPPGKNVIVISAYLPYNTYWNYDSDIESYNEIKEEAAQVFIERASEYLPGLQDHIEVMDVGSPRTMEYYTLNPKGAVYGWRAKLSQFGKRRLAQETPVENLYLAGMWTQPGHGQSNVLRSGTYAAELILKKEDSR